MAANTTFCAPAGNGDIYGLGIRTGFYTHWLSTLLVTLFIPSEESIYRGINILLQTAVLICLFCMTSWGRIYAFEAVIAFWLLAGSLSSLTGDGISPLGDATGVLRLVVYTAMSGYGCWFWISGVDGAKVKVMEGGCEEYGFLGRVKLRGGFSVFAQLVSVVGMLICVAMLGGSLWALWKGEDEEEEEEVNAAKEPNSKEEPSRKRWWQGYCVPLCKWLAQHFKSTVKKLTKRNRQDEPRQQTDLALVILSIGVIIFSITSLESLIRDNQAQGVDSLTEAGQFIPMFVGVFGLVCAVIAAAGNRKNVKKPRRILWFGRHSS
jgi:hypothetical protein